MEETQAKVSYQTRDGYISKAYIDPETGEGEDKHSGIPVTLEYDEGFGIWKQIDDRQWMFLSDGTVIKIDPLWIRGEEDQMYKRQQPKKKLSRAKRKKNK